VAKAPAHGATTSTRVGGIAAQPVILHPAGGAAEHLERPRDVEDLHVRVGEHHNVMWPAPHARCVHCEPGMLASPWLKVKGAEEPPCATLPDIFFAVMVPEKSTGPFSEGQREVDAAVFYPHVIEGLSDHRLGRRVDRPPVLPIHQGQMQDHRHLGLGLRIVRQEGALPERLVVAVGERLWSAGPASVLLRPYSSSSPGPGIPCSRPSPARPSARSTAPTRAAPSRCRSSSRRRSE